MFKTIKSEDKIIEFFSETPLIIINIGYISQRRLSVSKEKDYKVIFLQYYAPWN